MATMRVPERAFSFALMTLARQLLLKTSYHSLTRISCSLHGSDQNMSHTRTKSSCLQLRNDKMFNVTSNTSTHFSTQRQLPRVYLFTKEGCTLCEEAKEVLKPIMHKFILEEVDITLPENEHWFNKYKYDIPVFHVYEDFICKHRVDLKTFETALEKYEK